MNAALTPVFDDLLLEEMAAQRDLAEALQRGDYALAARLNERLQRIAEKMAAEMIRRHLGGRS